MGTRKLAWLKRTQRERGTEGKDLVLKGGGGMEIDCAV